MGMQIRMRLLSIGVKDFNAIPNLQIILADEGFEDAKLFYLGGKWVMFEFDKVETKTNLMKHVGVNSWFHEIQDEKEYMLDDDSVRGENFKEMQPHLSEEEDGEFNTSDVEGVAETILVITLTRTIRDHVFGEEVTNMDKEFSSRISAKIMNNSQAVQEEVSCNSVGQSEAKKGGNSGGILCIWEETVFKKDHVTIYDSFVAIYETWVPNKAKILIVTIYDPQYPKYRQVRNKDERRGSWFNSYNLRLFDNFISSSGLVDVKIKGYMFTWSHPSANKMSKLDRFLVSDGVISLFPSITALCLDRHLSNHRLIILSEVKLDFGPVPFCLYHSWFSYVGFNDMEQTWRSFSYSDSNGMIRFKKKFQELKKIMRLWIKDKNTQLSGSKQSISVELSDIDKELDQGDVFDSLLLRRHELKCQLNDIKVMEATNSMQKSKIRWAIEGDENSKYFHAADLEMGVSRDEIRLAMWDCGENNSPGLDGFTSEFFRKYWECIGPDFCAAVKHFFENGSFSKCCNSSFIALIPKVTDAKFVNDYQPISLIGSVYKVVTKIMANRLALVITDIVSDSQSAFVAKRQILDGPFILNEVLHWCKRKNKKVMFFKVDFAKAYDSVRWDFLIDVLEAFGFGPVWCNWIRGTFCFAKGLILVNGSPSNEFQFHCGLKQGDPLSPYLFILIMESLHLSVSRAVNEGLFKGIRLQGSLSLSYLFYANDALFIGLQININKSQVLGVGVPRAIVEAMAVSIGCSIMQQKFRYLGVLMGECMSRHKAWDDVVLKLRSRLSKWKAKTLSIGGRLTHLKSVLGASPLYTMSIFKVSKGVLKGDKPFCDAFPRIFALELNCQVSVTKKLAAPLDISLRRSVRGGVEQQQFTDLSLIIDSVSLTPSFDRWVCSVSSDGDFSVKEVRNVIDDLSVPTHSESTR
nr:RNA-directed DNA polymerase, eukaryota [Tanacetum cinerariifolium]